MLEHRWAACFLSMQCCLAARYFAVLANLPALASRYHATRHSRSSELLPAVPGCRQTLRVVERASVATRLCLQFLA